MFPDHRRQRFGKQGRGVERFGPVKVDILLGGVILESDIDKMPVVDENNGLIGYLTFRDILDSYDKRVKKKK